jgi:hypothetical protein
VAVRVHDAGGGIPPEVLGRVCEPFFTTKPPGEGTGHGLSQAHGFAADAGGALRVESEPGRGTEVTFLLPASAAAEAGASAGRPVRDEGDERGGAAASPGRPRPDRRARAGAGRVAPPVGPARRASPRGRPLRRAARARSGR